MANEGAKNNPEQCRPYASDRETIARYRIPKNEPEKYSRVSLGSCLVPRRAVSRGIRCCACNIGGEFASGWCVWIVHGVGLFMGAKTRARELSVDQTIQPSISGRCSCRRKLPASEEIPSIGVSIAGWAPGLSTAKFLPYCQRSARSSAEANKRHQNKCSELITRTQRTLFSQCAGRAIADAFVGNLLQTLLDAVVQWSTDSHVKAATDKG